MSTIDDITLLIPSLKNTVAQPGTFATAYSETSDSDLIGVLKDALAECHFEGILRDFNVTGTTIVNAAGTQTGMPDDSQAAVVTFAAIRLIRSVYLNRASVRHYTAGRTGPEFQEEYSSSLQKSILSDLYDQKKRIVDVLSDLAGIDQAWFAMGDQFFARVGEPLTETEGWSTRS